MSRRFSPLFASLTVALCLLAACGPSINTKENVREDLLAHLQSAGLDTKALDIDITQVTFKKNQARAAVSFRPKGASNIHDGMMMNYTLQSRDGHWVVVGRADSQGHGAPQSAAGTGDGTSLPPGHPPLGSPNANPHGMGTPQLPPGHPQVNPQTQDGSAAPDGGTPLPPGHPKASATDRRFEPETGTQIATELAA